MDAIDRGILHHLEIDGRLTNAELAERVALSPSPCLRRVRRLERDGVITGYRADISAAALGRSFEIIVHIDLLAKDHATIEAFEDQIAKLPEVLECRRMYGQPDYLVRVGVADQNAYEQLYMNKLTDLPGVVRFTSQFTMKTIKRAP